MTPRVLMVLSALAAVLLGTAGTVDDPALLAGLLGTAVLLLGSARAARRVVVTAAGVVPAIHGHRAAPAGLVALRQCDPDGAGRMRARAPAGVLRAV